MGKGYNNYMCKKFFHPTNFDNIKRKWMAEQADEFESKKEQEKLNQYRREQEMLENRVLLGDEKARLGLAWMYDQPALVEKEIGDEKEVKFEWQRKYNAPRETYCKNSTDVMDQPFAIEVRNVRCMRCKQWGHLNTDRICPLFGQSFTNEPMGDGTLNFDSAQRSLRKEGLAFKKGSNSSRYSSILKKAREKMKDIDHESTQEEDSLAMEFLRNLSERKREKLLRKLSELSSSDSSHSRKRDKHNKHCRHKHR